MLNFPELFSVQRPAHTLHHISALGALAFTVSASLEAVECHLTLFQMFTKREFLVLVWTDCLSFLLAVDLQ